MLTILQHFAVLYLCCTMVSRPILYQPSHHNLHCIVCLTHSIYFCLTLVQTLSEIFKSGYSRIPVYGVDRHDIIGLILTKDLIFLDADVSTGTARIAASPLFSSLFSHPNPSSPSDPANPVHPTQDETTISNFVRLFGRQPMVVWHDQKLGETLTLFRKGR